MGGWNGSGTFSRTHNWTQDQGNGILIRADRHDTNDTDFVNGINNCLTKDGQNTPSANLAMATYKHTGVGNATARNQYAAMGQIQDQSGVWCGTAGGTANALTLSPSPAITAYAAGQSFVFKAGASANTAAATVTISGVGTPPAIQYNGAALVGGEIEASQFYRITLDTATTAQLEAFGQQSFTDVVTVRGVAANAGRIRLGEDSDNGTNYAEIIAPAALGSNVVLTAPSSTGTLALTADNLSAGFSAWATGGQSVAGSGSTAKIQFNNEDFDTNGWFDSATNYRFTPQIAGKYQVQAMCALAAINADKTYGVFLYKNGSLIRQVIISNGSVVQGTMAAVVTGLVDMNGTTDYLEAFAYNGDSVSQTVQGGIEFTNFSAFLVRM